MRHHPARLLRLALPGLAVALLASPAAFAASYQVDGERSVLLLRVWKEGGASFFAHDHVARATRLTGAVRYDPARPEAASVEVTAESDSVVMDEPLMRKRFDMRIIPDVNRREIQNTMRSAKQLDVATYPTIAFRSSKVEAAGAGKLRITGTLTLHGKSKVVSFPAVVEMRGGFLHADAAFRFLQSDFGIKPYSFTSAVRNQDEVEMQVELIAAPGEASAAAAPSAPAHHR